jgi:hypothetical protein
MQYEPLLSFRKLETAVKHEIAELCCYAVCMRRLLSVIQEFARRSDLT